MNLDRKSLLTGSLLVFVAFTAATLGIKEMRHARAVAAAGAAVPSTVATPAPPPGAPAVTATTPRPVASAQADPAREASREGPSTTRVAREGPDVAAAAPAPSSRDVPAAVADGPATIVVSYFHTTVRCASCLKVENLTTLAVTTRFAVPISEKRLVWRVVNVDEPENDHFTKDYGLYTKSVVVSEVRDGREVRWKNLDQVWKLLGEPERFQDYVEKEVRAFLEPA